MPRITVQRRKLTGNKKILVVAVLCVYLLLRVAFPPSPPAPFPPAWMRYQEPATCQHVHVYPFRVGCPSTCSREIDGGPMYRMHVAWKFGYLHESSDSFRGAPRKFVEGFKVSLDHVSDLLSDHHNVTGNLRIKRQVKMHMSLAYFCCIPDLERAAVQEAMREWSEHHYESPRTKVRFDRLECWKERHNSITNIVVGDDRLQKTLFPIYMDLVHYVQQRVPSYNPMVVPRTEQMPFHITLIGTYYGSKEQGASIDPMLPVMAQVTQAEDIFHDLPPLSLDFAPYVSNPTVHT